MIATDHALLLPSPMSGSRKVPTTRSTWPRTLRLRRVGAIRYWQDDGIPKTREWAEKEGGVPAREIRALAREWGEERPNSPPAGWAGGAAPAAPPRHRVGPRHDGPGHHAGHGQARLHMWSHAGAPVDNEFYFPVMPTAASPATARTPPHCARASPFRLPEIPFGVKRLGSSGPVPRADFAAVVWMAGANINPAPPLVAPAAK